MAPANAVMLIVVDGTEITALASVAANIVVTTAVTDAFEGLRQQVARLFGRGKPDPATERRLETTRTELTAAAGTDIARVGAAQQVQWQVRFADLLDTYPEVTAELSALIADVRSELSASGNVTNLIAGGVQYGPVIMGRDFTGVTLHADPASSAGP